VTTDMKWIDIKIKNIRVKINEQSEIDARAGLLDVDKDEDKTDT